MRRVLLPAFLSLAFGVAAAFGRAQTLPQSTVDRQTIAQLQYQLSMPGITAVQRREIEMQITQLEYQINTRPPIVPPPFSRTPQPALQGAIPYGAAQYAVPATADALPARPCDADRSVIAYLRGQLRDDTATAQERAYNSQRIRDLQRDLHARNC